MLALGGLAQCLKPVFLVVLVVVSSLQFLPTSVSDSSHLWAPPLKAFKVANQDDLSQLPLTLLSLRHIAYLSCWPC